MPPGRLEVEDVVTLQSAAGASGNGTALDVAGFASVLVQVTGSSPVGTITFEGSVDGTNFVAVPAANLATGAVATTTTAVGVFSVPVAGLRTFRARLTFSSGTWTVTAQGTTATAIGGSGSGAAAGTVNQGTANAAGTASWPVQGAGASGAAKAGNPVQTGGVYNSTQPTVTTGQTVEAQRTARGAAIVATGVDPLVATGAAATGAAVSGSPVYVGGKDSAGNAQPLKTDTLGGVLAGGPTAANILNGFANYTSTQTVTTLITVPASRTWVGEIGASLAVNQAAAGTNNTHVEALFTTTGAGVTPAAGSIFQVDVKIGPHAAGGTVGSQGMNFGRAPMTVIAPVGNSVTISITVTGSFSSSASISVFASGQIL